MKIYMMVALLQFLGLLYLGSALPSRRQDLLDDYDPSEPDSEMMDQIAEESEVRETVVDAPRSRGSFRFSSSYDGSSLKTNSKVDEPQDEDEEKGVVTQAERERALMLVLPYDAKNLSESKIEELYTKKPVTWMINTTTIVPSTEAPTERTSTTVLVTPTPLAYRRRITAPPTTQAPTIIRDDVKELLASIGLFPSTSTTTARSLEMAHEVVTEISPEMKDILAQFGLNPNDRLNTLPQAPVTETFQIADAYDPIQSPNNPPITYQRPSIDPLAYSVFKPIPVNKYKTEVSGDMKEFLANFGLVDNSRDTNHFKSRAKQLHSKAEEEVEEVTITPAPNAIPTLHPESMNDEMRDALRSLGLLPDAPQIEERIGTQHSRAINSASIFNPIESVQNAVNSTKEVETLKNLLSTYKLLTKNATTPEELELQIVTATEFLQKRNLTKLVADAKKPPLSPTLDKLLSAPDPLSYEELLQAVSESRNDIFKRQQAELHNTTAGYPKVIPTEKFEEETTTSDAPETSTSTQISSSTTSSSTQAASSSTSTTTQSSTTSTTTEAAETDSESIPRFPDTSDADTTSTDSTGSEQNNSPSLADLESSFGGNGDETPDESLPPPKPNGFYFLLDLNTFLDVGEDEKGVHLKFNPRAGNSRNFLSVTVP